MSTRRFIPIRPVHLAERRCGPAVLSHERYRGFVAEPHAHDALQVTLPLAGRMHLQVGEARYLVGPEGLIVLPAGVEHAVGYLDGALDFFLVTAPAAWLAGHLEALGAAADLGRPWVVSLPYFWPLGRHMAAEVDAPGPGTDRLLAAGLDQLGLLLARALAVPEAAVPPHDPRILRAVDRVLREYAEPLTVERLAAEAHMTARHFERLFRRAVGASPRRFLIDTRLAAARTLLETTERPVTAIALDVGFQYAAHFGETFRKATGQTPQGYRASNAKKGPTS